MRNILVIAAGILLAIGSIIVSTSNPTDHSAHAAICNNGVPLGALSPAVPEWCKVPLAQGIDTHQESASAWVDDFNHGQSHASLSSAYARGEANGDGCDIIHFQHNDHWMVDLQGDNGEWPTLCAAWMRSDRTFHAENGKLVLEFQVASPIAGTKDADGLSDAWPEFTLSLDPSPGNLRQNGTYLYETMAGYWTFGCRMQQTKHPICALYEPLDGPPARPQREWEINQNGGDVVSDNNGGDHVGTGDAIDVAWKGCTSVDDPDTVCRNFHRVEITATSIRFFHRNATQTEWTEGYSATFINDHLGNILNAPGGFYVYFGDFAYRISQDIVVRFHWDRLAVNPEALGAGSSPTATPTSPAPTNTPTAAATLTPTPTSVATATATPTRTPTGAPCRVQVRNASNTGWTYNESRGSYTGTLVNGVCGR